MSYRNLLVERFRRVEEQPVEPSTIDYLEHRNRDALRAWRQRQFEYEFRGRHRTLAARRGMEGASPRVGTGTGDSQ